MSVKVYLNKITGEVINAYSKIHAYAYFKRDGKKCGYSVSLKDVRLIGLSALGK